MKIKGLLIGSACLGFSTGAVIGILPGTSGSSGSTIGFLGRGDAQGTPTDSGLPGPLGAIIQGKELANASNTSTKD